MNKMTFFQFCERLKSDGAYIGDDNHVHRKDGRLLSRRCKNGYFMVRKMYDGEMYHFMEHRVIWYFANGEFDESMEINHIDYDRGNNAIGNLELVTHSGNIIHSLQNRADTSGPNHWKAYFSEKDVQLIRLLAKHGYKRKEIAKLYDAKNENLISRVVTGARYGNVLEAGSIVSVYPLLVEKTSRTDLSYDEQLVNCVFGLCGETGEVADHIKKSKFQGHELDVNHIIEELGDVMFYICWMCNLIGVDFSEICYSNMEKLTKRYPKGFDAERSINREENKHAE